MKIWLKELTNGELMQITGGQIPGKEDPRWEKPDWLAFSGEGLEEISEKLRGCPDKVASLFPKDYRARFILDKTEIELTGKDISVLYWFRHYTDPWKCKLTPKDVHRVICV